MSMSNRLGQFAIGLVAGTCAAVFPRLAIAIGAPAQAANLTVEIFTKEYVIIATMFVVLVGVVVVILGWNSQPTPKETFMSALGLPALLSGALNTASTAGEAGRLAQQNVRISDERAKEGGIQVEESDLGLPPSRESSLLRLQLLPIAFAQSPSPPQPPLPLTQWVGTTFSEPKYWVVVHSAQTRQEADSKRTELKARYPALFTQYGPLRIEAGKDVYVVCVGEAPLPYSQGVSKALDLKTKSHGALVPRLVRAK